MRKDIKQELLSMMKADVEGRIASMLATKGSIEESKQNETKSSAGDKFETGRAMMQMELDKIESQLDQLNMTKNQLKLLSKASVGKTVGLGTLVITDKGNFYISVSLGKYTVEGDVFFSISTDAPLAKRLIGFKQGDLAGFRDTKYLVQELR